MKGKTPGVRESYSWPTPSEHGPNSPWPAFDLLNPGSISQNRIAISIADGEVLDYLNACARLRTLMAEVELLVELSPLGRFS